MQCIEQRGGATFQITELFPEQVVARTADATYATPDPCSREIRGVIVKLVVEQAAPEYFPSLITHPATNPAGRFDFIQRVPILAFGRQECMQTVAEFGNQA